MRQYLIFIYTLFTIIYFSGCSQKVDSIEDFESIKLDETNKSHIINGDRNFLKYQIFAENDVEKIRYFLNGIENISIVEELNNNIDFKISIEMEEKKFGNRIITFGKMYIFNQKLGFMEDIIPIVNDNIEKHNLHKLFSPIRGYILEKRVNRDDEVIFKIDIGKNKGVKSGASLNIYKVQDNISHFSGLNKISFQRIGVGIVSKILDNNSAWFYIEDSHIAKKISKGDFVLFDKSDFGSYIEDGKKFIQNKNIINNNLRF